MKKGRRLTRGSVIGVVAPAGVTHTTVSLNARKKLEELGFQVVMGRSCYGKWLLFSGTDDERAEDINRMFADPAIDGIIALRGGHGSIRLAEKLDYPVIRSNPKVFVGFSDITILHILLNTRCGLITFHGPMAASHFAGTFDPITGRSFHEAVCTRHASYTIENPAGRPMGVLAPGRAEGRLTGGNLSVAAASLGTGFELDTRGKILFIEEVDEKSYRIDRMMVQLMLAGKFEAAAGIILGDFTGCGGGDGGDSELEAVFKDIFSGLGKPVMTGLKSGHCSPMLTLPFGAVVRMDSDARSVRVMEAVTTD